MWGHRNLPWVILLCIHNGEPLQLYIHFHPVYEAKSTLFWWISICYTVVVMVASIHFLRETSSYKGPMLYAQSINPSKRANWSVPCVLQLCPTSSFNSSSLNGMKRPWVHPTHSLNHTLVSQDPGVRFPTSQSQFPGTVWGLVPESVHLNATGHISTPRNGPGGTDGGSVGGTWTLEEKVQQQFERPHTLQSGARMWREEHGPGTKDSVLSTKRPALPDHCDLEWNSKESEKFKFEPSH